MPNITVPAAATGLPANTPGLQVLRVCRQCAAEIRDTATNAGPDTLDDADRKSLQLLADLIEIRAGYKVELRPTMERAIEGAIGLLDALEAPSEDIEDDDPAEPVGDDEHTLGWSAGMSQLNLPDNSEDGDKTAPERHGKGFVRCGTDDHEPEAGYDLPERDEEWDGEGEDAEPNLGAALNHHNQTDWGQGSVSDAELVNEDGISRDHDRPDWRDGEATRIAARDLARRAVAMRRRKDHRATVARDPDEVQRGNLRLIGGGLVHVVGVAR